MNIIFLIGLTIVFILITILAVKIKALNDLITENKEYITKTENSLYIGYMDNVKNIEKLGYDLEEEKRNIEAIASGISIFQGAVTGEKVEDTVKKNVDLFGQWIYGDEE